MLRKTLRVRSLGQAVSATAILIRQSPRITYAIDRQIRKASTSSLPLSQSLPQDDAAFQKDKEQKRKAKELALKEAANTFEVVGLNSRLSLQLVSAFPSIRSPTAAQKALLSAIAKDNDIILRAHTGTGKSFALLLGLLNKPRLVVRESFEEARRDKRIASIIVVPSRELALQYEGWAKQLFPKNMHHTLPSAVAVMYRNRDISVDEHLNQLVKTQPHVLVITPTLLQDMLSTQKGPFILGISTLRSLVYDEGDALLELPSRFPSQKLIWNHLQHPADGLQALNTIMKSRATFSGGVAIPSAGLETDRRAVMKESIRRKVHQGNDLLEARRNGGKKQKFVISEPKELLRNERPLQLIIVSATANSVLRNFLGAKTGWLRTGVRDENRVEIGKWLDLTGLSQGVNKGEEVFGLQEKTQSGWALQLPKELKHSCVVVDEPIGEIGADNWRELIPKLARQGNEEREKEVKDDDNHNVEAVKKSPQLRWGEVKPAVRTGPLIVAPTESSQPSMDEHLLTCLAYLYASQPVLRALALVPATWSIAKAREYLAHLDVPVRYLSEAKAGGEEKEEEEEVLYIIQANTVRGIDVPGGLSHVFCLGVDSVRDATGYTHLAGRAARIGHNDEGGHQRPTGHVITLVRGLSTEQARQNHDSGKLEVIASSELKMSLIYRRLNLKVAKLNKQQGDEEVEEDMQPQEYEKAAAAEIPDLSQKENSAHTHID
ncbi:hypothetical protein CBS101457_001973 [Exobasidium rhododendri]|nr:hypothetical protein CBS101457_001973 [Exobasidium rhododendri]